MNQIKQVCLPVSVEGPEAWGTAAGLGVLSRFHDQISRVSEGTTITLDFSNLPRGDVSFFREAIVELLRRHRPRLSFIAEDVVDSDVLANLEAALASADERLLLRRPEEAPLVLGRPLASEYFDTLRFVQEFNEFASSILTKPPFNLGQSTASARLSFLWKSGLVGRRQGVATSGGKEYRYHPIR